MKDHDSNDLLEEFASEMRDLVDEYGGIVEIVGPSSSHLEVDPATDLSPSDETGEVSEADDIERHEFTQSEEESLSDIRFEDIEFDDGTTLT